MKPAPNRVAPSQISRRIPRLNKAAEARQTDQPPGEHKGDAASKTRGESQINGCNRV